MRIFQALRRSIKGEKDKPHIQIAPKSAIAIVPPKKVSYELYPGHFCRASPADGPVSPLRRSGRPPNARAFQTKKANTDPSSPPK